MWFLLACAEEPAGGPDNAEPAACEVSVESTEVATVLRVRWTTDAPTRGRVVFDNGDGLERSTAWDAGDTTDHEALLLGALPLADVAWRVETEGDCTASGASVTGALPTGLPEITASDIDAARAAGGLTLVPLLTPEVGWLTILDEEGRYVWAWSDPRAANARKWPFRAALAADGLSILFNVQAETVDVDGTVSRVGLDGVLGVGFDVPGGHTDFVELPDGGVVSIGWEIRDFGDRRLLGDTLVTVDTSGTSRVLWNVFDHFTPDLSAAWQDGFYLADPAVEDWSHVNGLTRDPVTGDLLVTMTFNSGIARIDGATGEQEWVIDAKGGDFSADPAQPFPVAMPHSVEDLGDGRLLVFNRGDLTRPNACSEAVELRLDGSEIRLETTWRNDPCLLVAFLGQARRLWNGNTEITWSSAGVLDEVTPEGDLVSRFGLGAGAAFGFSERLPGD